MSKPMFLVEYKDYVSSISILVYRYDQRAEMYDKDTKLSQSFESALDAKMYATHVRRILDEETKRKPV